jgi:hypothetical protein
MNIRNYIIILVASLMLSCGGGGGGSEPPKPMPPLPPPPEPPIELIVCLEWDAVVHPELEGYTMYYGKVSDQYDNDLDVLAPETTVCIADNSYFIEGSDYYFVVTAFSATEESEYSNEVKWTP